MTIQEFINENKITMITKQVDTRPDVESWSHGSRHYKITLKNNGKRFTFFFSQGSAIKNKPTLDEVFECLVSDALAVDYVSDVWDFAQEYGYNLNIEKDYKRAVSGLRACKRTDKALTRLFGDSFREVDL